MAAPSQGACIHPECPPRYPAQCDVTLKPASVHITTVCRMMWLWDEYRLPPALPLDTVVLRPLVVRLRAAVAQRAVSDSPGHGWYRKVQLEAADGEDEPRRQNCERSERDLSEPGQRALPAYLQPSICLSKIEGDSGERRYQ